MMCKKNIFRTLIPLFEQYECKDFTKLYTYLTNYTMNKNNPLPIIIKKQNDVTIPYEKQWESRDF